MKSSETEEPNLSMISSPRKADLTIKEDKDGEKLSSAEDEARPHIRCPRKHEVSYSDSDLTDNSSGGQGQGLMVIIVMKTMMKMMMVCVC